MSKVQFQKNDSKLISQIPCICCICGYMHARPHRRKDLAGTEIAKWFPAAGPRLVRWEPERPQLEH